MDVFNTKNTVTWILSVTVLYQTSYSQSTAEGGNNIWYTVSGEQALLVPSPRHSFNVSTTVVVGNEDKR